jgi:hypothetical protein
MQSFHFFTLLLQMACSLAPGQALLPICSSIPSLKNFCIPIMHIRMLCSVSGGRNHGRKNFDAFSVPYCIFVFSEVYSPQNGGS